MTVVNTGVRWDRVTAMRDLMRDFIRPEEFSLCFWGTRDKKTNVVVVSCATPACIAGHVCAYFGWPAILSVRKEAADILGLDEDQSDDLFRARNLSYQITWDQIKPKHVAEVLDHFIEHGEINWAILDPNDFNKEKDEWSITK